MGMAREVSEVDGIGVNTLYLKDLARGFGGAILFAFPLLMTMEMWWLGFYIAPIRLAIFLVINFGVLLGLSWFVGFSSSEGWRDMGREAAVAYGIGISASTVLLYLFGILEIPMPIFEAAGKIAIQAIPASLGAIVARRQLSASSGPGGRRRRENRAGYAGQLFLMAGGALYLSFNVAPTEEMVLIAYKMTPARQALLIGLSVLLLHGFVYTVGFRGQEPVGEAGNLRVFLSYTLAGYGIAVLVSLYVLWTFGRTDGTALPQIAAMTAVLGLPSALGAALARLVV